MFAVDGGGGVEVGVGAGPYLSGYYHVLSLHI